MKEYLLVCSCSGRKEKAQKSLALICPEAKPEVVKGKTAIAKLASECGNDHIKAIAKLNGNFSYYVQLDDDNKIIKEYDLITGRRTA